MRNKKEGVLQDNEAHLSAIYMNLITLPALILLYHRTCIRIDYCLWYREQAPFRNLGLVRLEVPTPERLVCYVHGMTVEALDAVITHAEQSYPSSFFTE